MQIVSEMWVASNNLKSLDYAFTQSNLAF